MIALLRQWLLQITAAALFAALAESMMPQGAAKRVGRLSCGLMLLWVLLRPLPGMRTAEFSMHAGGLETAADERRAQLADQSGQVMKAFIEQRLGAYITDKAVQLGIPCACHVECEKTQEGAWLPSSVQVSGSLDAAQRDTLTQLIRTELAVPQERQWYGGE